MDNKDRKYYVFPSLTQDNHKSSSLPALVEVGGKALSLYQTSTLFNVPPGFVLAVSFFEPWIDLVKQTEEWKKYTESQVENVTKEDCDAIKEQCKKILSLNRDQTTILEHAAKEAFRDDANIEDNSGTVAVRSSSPEEDLAGTSFAGGYETTLGVTTDKLQDAIIHSFASLFDHRIHMYKAQHSMSTKEPRIAIIIQRQIASTVSGVGFSINPNNNCYDEIMISANFGLGESVVGGIVTPDTYIVDRSDPNESKILSKNVAEKTTSIWLDETGGGTLQKVNDNATLLALTDEQILEVANLVAHVEEERYDGLPVDTEWAYDGEGNLYLLQARPVTAYVPLFEEMITKRGEEKRLYLDIMVMSQGFSDPLSTLGLDLWRTILARMKPTMSTEGREGLIWNLHGREYFNISNLLKMKGGSLLVHKSLRSYEKALDRAFDSIDLNEYTPSRMPEGAKGIHWKILGQLWKTLPHLLKSLYKGSESMSEYIQASNAIIEDCYNDECSTGELFEEAYEHLMTRYNEILPALGGISAALISRYILHRMFAGREDANDHLINLMMDLTGNPTSEMGHHLLRLASYPEFQETKTSNVFLQKIENGSYSQEFVADYKEFLKCFGCRGIREIDAATPRTYENIVGLYGTLKAIDINNNQIINVRERRDKSYQALLNMSRTMDKEKKFVHHASVVQGLLGYREHPKYMLVVMIDRMRRHALNIAAELVAQGRLDVVNDIFWLNIKQVTEAQKNPDMELQPLIRANMEPVQMVKHVKNWPKLIDSRGKIIRGEKIDNDNLEEGTLLGDPIAPGTVVGPAKVLMSPYEKPVMSGEILVARFTEPSWTPLFINAVGVVLEIGGPMQHGAIIAREYGIPCVSGIDNATKVIKDGDLLEIDGSSGIVRVIGENDNKST